MEWMRTTKKVCTPQASEKGENGNECVQSQGGGRLAVLPSINPLSLLYCTLLQLMVYGQVSYNLVLYNHSKSEARTNNPSFARLHEEKHSGKTFSSSQS
jgi:hypothetical protein